MRTKGVIYIGGLAVLAVMGVILLRSRHPATPVSTGPTPAAVATTTQETETAMAETLPMALLGSRRAPLTVEASSVVKKTAAASLVSEGMNLSGDLWRRQQAVRALPHDLTREEQETLIKFLKERHAEDDGQGGHVLKNDLMDALVAQDAVWPELAEVFTAIYRDATQHLVIRDYAVQHLSLLHERLDEPAGWENDRLNSRRKLIEETLWAVTGELDSSMAGTALLGLTRLSEKESGLVVDRQRLGEAALKIASDSQTQEASRITACQICARLQVKAALPLLSQMAVQSENVTLQISALGALGLMGGKAELSIIEQIVAGGNTRLEKVAAVAIRRIQERENQL